METMPHIMTCPASFRLDPRLEAAGIEKVRRLCYERCELLCRQVSCLLLPDGGELDLHMGSHLTTRVVSILLVLYGMCASVMCASVMCASVMCL